MALRCRRHSSPSGAQSPSSALCPSGGMALSSENLVTHGHLHIDDETRRLLLQMSLATIGRLLAAERRTYRHGLCYTRSILLGGRIPVQTCMGSFLPIPGVLAADLVGRGEGRPWEPVSYTHLT